jgi:DNA-binding IclR family transcriptional regulator
MSSKSYAVAELCQAVDADADEVRAFLGELVSAGLVVRDRG